MGLMLVLSIPMKCKYSHPIAESREEELKEKYQLCFYFCPNGWVR